MTRSIAVGDDFCGLVPYVDVQGEALALLGTQLAVDLHHLVEWGQLACLRGSAGGTPGAG